MAKCHTIARSGQPCRGLVRAGNDYCPAHDPRRQEARSRASSKAGKSKPGRELADVKRRLSALADDVCLRAAWSGGMPRSSRRS
jgi:hypothetical protein